MSSILLYAICVLVWGTTWLFITFQLGTVPPATSVTYRFFLAFLLAYLLLWFRGKVPKLNRQQHAWVALQGLSLFCINYVLTYMAESSVSSGLCAVVFSTVVGMNIFNSWLFFRKPIHSRVVTGAILGLIGISLVFKNEFVAFQNSRQVLVGCSYILGSTYIASLGNMVAVRNHKSGIPVFSSNTVGMFYGALFTLLYVLVSRQPFTFEWTSKYVGSLFYLAIFGSVIAFYCYLTLVGRIGADRAGYSAVVFPIVALLLSTIFENYHWSPSAVAGVGMILSGNVLVLRKEGTDGDTRKVA